jgi:phage terminase small subunit
LKITNKNKGMTKLTNKQERFCYEYCIDLNATQAAIRAGYNGKTAYSIGCENLKKPEIQSRIKEMQDNLAETSEVSSLRVLKELAAIAFSSIAHMHKSWVERKEFEELTETQKLAIKSISTKVLKKNADTKDDPEIIDVEYVKIELHDKIRALERISMMLGYDAPKKIDHTSDGERIFNGFNFLPYTPEADDFKE